MSHEKAGFHRRLTRITRIKGVSPRIDTDEHESLLPAVIRVSQCSYVAKRFFAQNSCKLSYLTGENA
jgi:hypothetical protein